MARKRPNQRHSTVAAETSKGTAVAPVAVDATKAMGESVPAPRRRHWIRLLVLFSILGGLFAIKHLWWPPLFRRQAAEELRRDHIDAGLAWLEYVDWLVPEDAATTLLRARASRKLGEMERVSELLAEAAREGATLEEIEQQQILARAQSGQLREAEPHLEGYLQNPPSEVDDVLEAYSLGFIRNLRFAKAQLLLETWMQVSPDLATPYLLRSHIWSFRNNAVKAEEDLLQALAIDPDRADVHYELAGVLHDGHQFTEAIPHYEACLDSPRHRVGALVGLALCLKAGGNGGDEALGLLRQAVQEAPTGEFALLELGRILIEIGEYENAAAALENLLLVNDRNPQAHYLMGQALSLNGQQEEAIPHLERFNAAQAALTEIDRLGTAILEDPTDVDALVRIGELYLQYMDKNEGVVRLLAALDLAPEHQQARQLLFEHYSREAERNPAFQSLADEHARHLQ